MSRRESLHDLVRTARDRIDTEALSEALSALDAHWRVTVLGRRSVGKSSLINAVLGRPERKVGLGGVTTEVAIVVESTLTLVDTPGIEDEAGALRVLQPLLEESDAAVWVVDGLQPMTATERRVVSGALVPNTPLWVVVSRLDLADPTDVDAVLARVSLLAEPFAPEGVRRIDRAWCRARA